MDSDDLGVMTGRMLPGAAGKQAPRVAVRQPQLAEPLQCHQREDDDIEDQAAAPGASSSRPAPVKPGPKASIITRSGRPRSISR